MVRILKQLGGVLGLFQKPILDKELSNEAIELIRFRSIARQAKNWLESDRLRDKLLAMGVTIKDSKI